MEDEGPIKANWGKLSKKFFKSIILDIVEDIGASKEELIYKYAEDKELAIQMMTYNSDSHSLDHQVQAHQFTPFGYDNNGHADMDVDHNPDEEEKVVSENSQQVSRAPDSLSWDNIEHLFGGDFKNTLSKHIRQGKVLLQTSPCLCGFHTYFSMKNTIESLLTEDPTEKIYLHLRSSLRTEFWSEYERVRTLLLQQCRMGQQDRQSIEEEGALERYMLRFLLANDPDLIRILGTYDVRIECVPLFYGFGLFQGEPNEIKEAARVFKEFHQTTKPFLLPIILGVVNHWNILLAFKRHANDPPQLIYLDSRNIEVLNIDEFSISEFVENRDREIRMLTGRPGSIPFYKRCLKNCLFDLRMLLFTLEDVLYTKRYDLKQLYTKRVIHNILKNFSRQFEEILVPKVAVGDESRSAVLKRRFLELRDVNLKSEMQEYLPFVLDCDTDFAPLFGLRKGTKEASKALKTLASWLTHCHEPYHLRKALVGTIKKLGRCVATEDLDVLLFWTIGVEHLVRNCVSDKFRDNHPAETFLTDQMSFIIDELKEIIQTVIDK